MCDFKPGDEVVCVAGGSTTFPDCGHVELVEGRTYTIDAVWLPGDIGETGFVVRDHACVQLVELGRLISGRRAGFNAWRFRKVERKKTDLSIEAFLTIKPGFEEPKRAPAKKRERA